MFSVVARIQVVPLPASLGTKVHFCRPAASSATYIVSSPDTVLLRSNITKPYGLPVAVINDVAVWPVVVGVPKPIENTLANPPLPDEP